LVDWLIERKTYTKSCRLVIKKKTILGEHERWSETTGRLSPLMCEVLSGSDFGWISSELSLVGEGMGCGVVNGREKKKQAKESGVGYIGGGGVDNITGGFLRACERIPE